MLAFVLSCGVSVAANLDAPELAAMLGGAVTDGPLAGLTYLVDPLVLADRQGLLDHARAQLGPDRYDAAYATGAAMSDRELIASTLAGLDRLSAEAGDG